MSAALYLATSTMCLRVVFHDEEMHRASLNLLRLERRIEPNPTPRVGDGRQGAAPTMPRGSLEVLERAQYFVEALASPEGCLDTDPIDLSCAGPQKPGL